LIDEVDMHLHPAWRQVVLQGLRRAFPSIQFIVTTHSPQVLSTVPSHCIRMLGLRWNEQLQRYQSVVEQPQIQTEGMPSADVLAVAMNTDPTPDVEPARQLSDYKALIQQDMEESEKARDLYARLLRHFGPGHPALRECEQLIRLQRFKRTLPPKE
jgi:predicted ATP-binding protein involved in virulence